MRAHPRLYPPQPRQVVADTGAACVVTPPPSLPLACRLQEPLAHVVDNVCLPPTPDVVCMVARFQRVRVRPGGVYAMVAVDAQYETIRHMTDEDQLTPYRRLFCIQGASVRPSTGAVAAADSSDGWVVVPQPHADATDVSVDPSAQDAPSPQGISDALAGLSLS